MGGRGEEEVLEVLAIVSVAAVVAGLLLMRCRKLRQLCLAPPEAEGEACG